MLVDLSKDELDEIVDALCCEHWDWNKRDYRSQLHQRWKIYKMFALVRRTMIEKDPKTGLWRHPQPVSRDS